MTHPTTISPEEQFEKFRMKYPSIRCTVYLKSRKDKEDMMVYSVSGGLVDESVKLATTIIRNNGLELVAERSSKVVGDSFIVKVKE